MMDSPVLATRPLPGQSHMGASMSIHLFIVDSQIRISVAFALVVYFTTLLQAKVCTLSFGVSVLGAEASQNDIGGNC